MAKISAPMVGCVLGLSFLTQLFAQPSFAVMPTNPVNDHDFMILPSGQNLTSIKVSGASLSLSRGTGTVFSNASQSYYLNLKAATKSVTNHAVQWVLMNLDRHEVVDQSKNPERKIFGASVAKIFVAATLLDRNSGYLSAAQTQLMADMLVVSSNTAWTELQNQIGDGDSNVGRERVHAFTQKMGYANTRGFQGYWGTMHGNELNAAELAEFLYDTYRGNYAGSETLWKFMHTCRTGASRGRKYIPTSVYVGAKTGTYAGGTENPETGSTQNPDGTAFTVSVNHHVMLFNVNGVQYGLAILANTGSDESAALMAGGIIHELGMVFRFLPIQ